LARFKLYLEFEGTRYAGWQIQKNSKTVQGEFFRVCEQIFNTKTFEFYGSGRTDAGVHAIEQVAHLDVQTDLPLLQVRYKLNDALPQDINILDIEKANPKFHARHDAIARSYIYLISKRKTALGKQFVWWIKDPLNIEKMRQAANELVGFKDFNSFTDDSPEEKSTLVELKFLDVYEYGDTIIIHTIGSHFLWKMVRRMVGILVETGRGNINPKEIQNILKNPDFPVAKYTAPPSGLFLEKVYYPGEEIIRGEDSFKLPFSVI
jgi:tRNA pseudouridine38-40 synthase